MCQASGQKQNISKWSLKNLMGSSDTTLKQANPCTRIYLLFFRTPFATTVETC